MDFAGAPYVLGPGDTMISSVPHDNRYWLERGAAWEYFWLILNGREALRIVGAVVEQAGPVLRLPSQAVDRLAQSCLSILSDPDPAPGQVSAAAYTAAMILYDAVFAAGQMPTTDLPAAVARAKTYMDSHFAEALDIGRVAAASGLSRAHFVRFFTKATGEPPSEYLFRTRVARAMRLLHATDWSVDKIARNCGFSDGNYLAKAFRRAHGMNPSGYRASLATDALVLGPDAV
jgi:AraC-like DNA-binding protein